jgi:hypothetical protein
MLLQRAAHRVRTDHASLPLTTHSVSAYNVVRPVAVLYV